MKPKNESGKGIDIYETLWYIYFITYFMDGQSGRICSQKRADKGKYNECGV